MKSLKYVRGAVFALLLFIIYGAAPADAASLRLRWASNTEADLAGYRLRIGTIRGQYTRTIDVGAVNSYEVPDLEVGLLYYFTVVAYDLSNNVSDGSDEVSGRIPPTGAAIPRVDAAIEAASQSMFAIPGGTRSIVVRGAHFKTDSRVRVGNSLYVSGVILNSSGDLVGQLDIPSNMPFTTRTVTVINSDTGTGSLSDALEFVRTSDINADCAVDVMDLNALARSWNETTDDARYVAQADLDNDGYVGPDDLTIFVRYYGWTFSGCP